MQSEVWIRKRTDKRDVYEPADSCGTTEGVHRGRCCNRDTRAEENSRATFQEDPNSRYSFDSERDAPKSEICREGKEKNRKCITVRPHARTAVSRFCIRQPTAILQLMMRSTAMFSAMQVRQCTASSTLNVSHNEIMTGARVLLCPTHGPRSDTHRMSAHT